LEEIPEPPKQKIKTRKIYVIEKQSKYNKKYETASESNQIKKQNSQNQLKNNILIKQNLNPKEIKNLLLKCQKIINQLNII
jgi:hypothetical protein